MATTATLNGGPTGGLHATTTLIHPENNPPQEETCRVDSNSSFESGNEETLPNNVLPGGNPSAWSTCEEGLDRSFDSESQAMDFRGSVDAKEGKKRRKQSRPVRIPATEMSITAAREHGSLLSESAGTGSEGDEAGELSSERGGFHSEAKSLSGGRHKHENNKSDDEEEGLLRPSRRQQLPLNLTGKYEPDAGSGGQRHCLLAAQSSALPPSHLHLHNSSIETDKTEAAGQGTKNSPSPHSRVVAGAGSPISRQFSPPLFSITSPSPFSAIFPTASGNPVSSYFQQQPPHSQSGGGAGIHQSSSGGNPPPGTPNSTSSTGSNQNGQGGSSGGMGGMPPHRIFNPEAYCELCNKEFCNKYFLKTHKANKHGVYSEVSSASLTSNQILAAAISSAPSSTSFLNMAGGGHPLSQCLSSQQPLASAASSSSQQLNKSSSSSTSDSAAFPSIFGDKNGSSNNNGGGGSQPRESFCELCQKEFCNKYFLKRHKAKIHGIPIPPETGSNSKPGSISGKSSSRHGFSNGDGNKRSSEDNMSGLPSLQDMGLDGLGLDLVGKQLEEGAASGNQGERDSQRDDIENANSDESNAPTNSLNSFQSEIMLAGENARLRSPEGNLGAESSSFKLSSLEMKPQQLGSSVGAENTCQFCFREFPSQQILRSHIIKKHRLLLQSAFPPFLLSFQPIPPSSFEEQANESAVLDSNGNAEMDFECNICSRSFQTIYLLRMHKSYFHPDADQESPDPLTTKMMSEASAMFAQAGAKSSTEREENEGDTDQGFDSDADVEAKSDSANKSAATIDIENRGEATSDSDDLRRLQTMIMELNRVSSSAVAWSPPLANVSTSPTSSQYTGQAGGSSLVCPICSKEFYSSYFLQQHIQHYHSAGGVGAQLGMGGDSQQCRIKTESPLGEINSNVSKKMSESGGGGGGGGPSSNQLLKDRMEDPGVVTGPAFLTPGMKGNASGESPLSKSVDAAGGSGGSLTGSSGGVKRPSPSLSRSYCTICHKELCNKYFMRTHMLKMHGISIESSTGLGGVTCDICNKELCSKYFLKVHKQNTHGIIEDGPSPPNPSTPGPPPQPLSNFPIVNPPIMNLTSGAASDTGSYMGQQEMSPSSLLPKEQSERYMNHFSEVCPLCGRRFRSSKWLKSHLQSDHGSEGREKWKSIEKSLQRRSPKMSSKPGNNNGPSSKSGGGGGSSLGKGSSSSYSNQKQVLTKDGNKCALCGFSSNDSEVMRSHLIKEHGNQLGAGHGGLGDGVPSPFSEGSPGLVLDPLTMLFQKMEGSSNKLYRCSYCPFSTSLLVYLYAHERTHTGLANSVTAPSPVTTPDAKCPFQCPMCFHTFQQPDAFQQHLIGHQMSGVLAPFFTPSAAAAAAAAAASSSCQYAMLPTSSENDPSGEAEGAGLFSSLPLLNGGSGSSLYMALNANKPPHLQDLQDSKIDDKMEEEDDGGAADLTTRKRQQDDDDDEEEEGDDEGKVTSRKRSKISHFRCICCHSRFKSREACVHHIREEHKGKRVAFKVVSMKRRRLSNLAQQQQQQAARSSAFQGKRQFRCRKCRFTCVTYTSLMVHSKLQHSIFRPGSMSNHGTEETVPVSVENEENASQTIPASSTATNKPVSAAVAVAGSMMMSTRSSTAAASSSSSSTWKMGNLPEGRGVPQHGVADGEFIMQGFLLTSSEEESSNQSGYFVPSLVYLPVREKVSQSIRVSFSLTPTS